MSKDKSHNTEDYKVGYGKPPKHTQFKKGQSGNPKGRPKGRKNMSTIINDVFNRKVTITENGQTRNVPYFEAFTRQFAAKGLHGTTRDQIMFLKAVKDYAPELLEPVPTTIEIEFVLPEGKTVADYEKLDRFGNKIVRFDDNSDDGSFLD